MKQLKRELTKQIKIKNIMLGGNNQVLIQSMTNTKTKDITSTVKQILQLEKEGCQIIRVAVLDMQDAPDFATSKFKKITIMPLIGFFLLLFTLFYDIIIIGTYLH